MRRRSILFFSFAASAAGHLFYERIAFGGLADPSLYVGIGLLVATIFVLAMFGVHAYRPGEMLSFRRQLVLISALLPAVLLFLLAVVLFLKLDTTVSRGAIITTSVLSMGGLIALRLCWHRHLHRAVARAAFPTRRVLLICPGTMPTEPVVQRAALSGLSVKYTMRIAEADLALASTSDAYEKHGIAEVDEVLVAWSDYANLRALEECLITLRQFCVPVSVMFGGIVGDVAEGFAQTVGERRVFQTHRPPLDVYERGLKRAFDIVFSIAALVLMFPICAVVAVAIKLDSPGPVFSRNLERATAAARFASSSFAACPSWRIPLTCARRHATILASLELAASFDQPAWTNCLNSGTSFEATCRWSGRAHMRWFTMISTERLSLNMPHAGMSNRD